MLVLKLHVLRQGKISRFLDDMIDVVELVKLNRLDLQSPEYRDLFLKYGTTELYVKIRQRSDYRERRLETVCPVGFDLEHPERIAASYPKWFLDEILPV